MNKKQVIIFKNRRKKDTSYHHHSGMWKVEYADFITAMMAFFLLLWLLSVTPEDTLKGVAEYFSTTNAISDKNGLGFDGGSETNLEKMEHQTPLQLL